MAKRSKTKTPSPNSRICCGAVVEITGGQLRGKRGKALLVAGSMWSVEVEGKRISLHRTCLRRVPEGQVAA